MSDGKGENGVSQTYIAFNIMKTGGFICDL